MLRSIGGSLLATRLRAALAAGAGVAVVLAAVVARLHHLRARRIKRSWPHGVEVRPSLIRGAGDGLFAGVDFAAGAWLGEYRGRVLSLLQATQLADRDYLMGGFGLNAHVDARFAMNAPARYVNDHFDKERLNARFDKNKEKRTATLVATRAIRRGEEIYASYGESYWRSRGRCPETGAPLPADEQPQKPRLPPASTQLPELN